MMFIKDEEFIRGNCPMTKEEIRILSVAKLNLREDFNVLDIGAGTGSVSIQMSKICSKGMVTSIEMDKEALEVLKLNKQKFNVPNMNIIEGDAVDLSNSIEDYFDAIFIGGSSGSIEEIIKRYALKLKSQGTMVLNFITIDNAYKAIKTLEELNFSTECSQISVSKTRGKSHMLMANNPIFILSARNNGGNSIG
ncbi:MAG: precorrin-6Y C5,15-methyltransferase (decarboxylating) subunit CbiT [Bacillota bacterium]|nr:precorrin-6Y C5,15-methyltransferase (decarboxylating) subunit CbiT [Bacillota bacterium]